jgi:essential nuclear protein 1
MGKAKKIKVSSKNVKGADSLADQINKGDFAEPSGRMKERKRRDEDDVEEYVEGKLSRSIMQQARLQAAELEEEMGVPAKPKSKETKLSIGEDEDEVEEDDMELQKYDDKEVTVDENDDLAVRMFMSRECAPRRTIADLIMEKIGEKKTEIDTQFSEPGDMFKELDPRVQSMYEEVGTILAKYRSGRIPKAFKVIAQFRNWEQLLYITQPDKWSAAALYQATRIFTSNLKEKMAQRFFNLILLPRVRDDIDTYHRLNFHLYQALRKALFKPGAFFKGFLLPLCEERNCSLRESIIIGSVLAKNSIPVLHSSAAMMKIAEMEYSGANSIFLRVLLDKKYALPYRVIDAIVFHYLGFRSEKRELPVLWFQSFLTFSQRYKQDISSDQKHALLDLCKIQVHHGITPEIQRELRHGRCRDEETAEPPMEM